MRKTKNDSSLGAVIYISKALACDAGGSKKHGGHVFELAAPRRRSPAACRCGMDQLTYDTFVKHASWR